MKQKSNNYRWFVVAVMAAFMFLHQSDKLLIGPLTTPIMETFGINEAAMGAVFTGALLVGAVLYPLWGYLYDRYSRAKLLSLASLIWGATTWLSAIAPTYPAFLVTRSSTGIDDSSYPGLYSLIADYFGPKVRGKVYGLLQLTQPLGYMAGLILATTLAATLGWRPIFFITGSLGIVLAAVIFLGVKEPPRGQSEPELAGVEQMGIYRFNKEAAFGLLKKRSLIFLYMQGFVGVFPWNVITYWFFRYLETERGFTSDQVLVTMAPAILVMAAGYFVGGAIGDAMFRRTPRGRIYTALFGVSMGAILFVITMNIPIENTLLFQAMLLLTALFIPFSSANIISTVYDITLPEVRSTALAIQYFIENAGAALSPLLAGILATMWGGLQPAILVICTVAWVLAAIFLALTAKHAPVDIHALRDQMLLRRQQELELHGATD